MNEPAYKPPDDNGPCQGAIYRNISVTTSSQPLQTGELSLKQWEFPYAITLSQECDLQQDYERRQKEEGESTNTINKDKLLPSILMCPGYAATSFREGKHLVRLNIKIERKTSDQYNLIKMNRDPRYHYLAAWTKLQVPEIVIDFKHFFTIQTELLRDTYGTVKYYIACLSCPYREHLSQRFTSYLGRIGLLVDHHRINREA